MNDLDIYIDTIFDGMEGYIYSPVKTTSDWKTAWFQFPEERDQLLEHIRKSEGDVYISPAVQGKEGDKGFSQEVPSILD